MESLKLKNPIRLIKTKECLQHDWLIAEERGYSVIDNDGNIAVRDIRRLYDDIIIGQIQLSFIKEIRFLPDGIKNYDSKSHLNMQIKRGSFFQRIKYQSTCEIYDNYISELDVPTLLFSGTYYYNSCMLTTIHIYN